MPSPMYSAGVLKSLYLKEVPSGFPDASLINGITEYWWSRCSGTHLPSRTDFGFEAMRSWIGNVSLVDVTHDPIRFRWRLIGSKIVDRLGRDSTGRWFEDLYEGQVLQGYLQAYSASVDRRQPVYFRGDLEFVGKEFQHFNSVHLPLSETGSAIDMLALCLEFG